MDFLEPYASKIESGLRNIELPATPETLYEPQRYMLSSNAKRIRPVLALMGCGLCGKPVERALPAALAIELIHNFTLMHDDIMDQADSRRGRKTVHIKWNTATAILAGDAMFVQAMQQLQHLPDTVNFKAIYIEFLDAINRVCEGQALDMEFEERDDVSSGEYIDMISGKTAALISASLKIGGMVGEATDVKLEQLNIIGHSMGLAFQVQDDLLDITADPETFGKKKSGDIFEGKKTYLMVRTLESCTASEKEWLIERLNNRPLHQNDVYKVIKLYRKYRIIESSEGLIADYYQKAENALNRFDDSNYKRDLAMLITYLKKREY